MPSETIHGFIVSQNNEDERHKYLVNYRKKEKSSLHYLHSFLHEAQISKISIFHFSQVISYCRQIVYWLFLRVN